MNKSIYFNEYEMRLIKLSDLDDYYKIAFETPDDEVKYFTGTISTFTKEQILSYLQSVVEDSTRYDFLILKSRELIGEVVLNDVTDESCHFRICLFSSVNFSKGIGKQATSEIIKFAFNDLGVQSIDLEVFPFNKRGISLYEKLGFEVTDKIVDEDANDPYRDIFTMKLLKANYNC